MVEIGSHFEDHLWRINKVLYTGEKDEKKVKKTKKHFYGMIKNVFKDYEDFSHGKNELNHL